VMPLQKHRDFSIFADKLPLLPGKYLL